MNDRKNQGINFLEEQLCNSEATKQNGHMNIEDDSGLSRMRRNNSSDQQTVSQPPDMIRSLSLQEAIINKGSPITKKSSHQQGSKSLKKNPGPEISNSVNNDFTEEPIPSQSAELIIQPVDGAQSNSFYCINETGGRIGRHSNNEIVILEESVSRHHSIIEYKEDKFYLVDIGSTTGSFIKVTKPLILEENMIIEMGSNQFFIQQIIVQDEENGELYIKILEGMHINKEFIINNSATIGRKGNSGAGMILLGDDFHLSNTHAKINYADGKFFLEDLGSTNGSWLRISPEGERSRPFELIDNMVFKIGASSTFRAKRSNSNYTEMMSGPKYDGSVNCAICYENDRDAVFIPCKHNVTCLKCAKGVKNCPVCRLKITDTIKIYKS